MKKILVAVDESPRTPSVVAAATELASRLGAKLFLFRAVTIPDAPLPEEYRRDPAAFGDKLERLARHQLDIAAREITPDLIGGVHVQFGVPWKAICKAAQADDVDCIVIGSHGYGAVDRLLGTTAAKVVNHADRSVMVVRAADRIAA